MKFPLMALVLAAGTLGSAAYGADLNVVTRQQSGRAIARLATQGLGYSVLHETVGISPRPYRVHVTCTIDESFMQISCPTPAYDASCPRAMIVCR